MNSLPLFHRIAGQPVIVLGEGDAAEAKRGLVERAGGTVISDPDGPARLAFVAHDEPEEFAASLKARGVLVNVVDRPELCDFTVPSLLERGPVLVAVGTGGVSAGLAKALRIGLEALLPASLGGLAQALGNGRTRLRERWPDAATRRRALDAALSAGGPLDPLADHPADAVQRWLDAAPDGASSVAEFTLVSDDPDDLTLRQARLLLGADVVIHDAAVPSSILNRARADAVRQVLCFAAPELPPGASAVIIRSR
jgi:uroporphyrin-III C-methyltransferase / precorrin-2 dehydrogenase / sirohydrochlorin ferrochelatase